MQKVEDRQKQIDQYKPVEQKQPCTSLILPEIKADEEEITSPPVQIQVGLAKFKQRFSLKKKMSIIDKKKQGIFQADNWFIGTSYYRQQWNQLFPHIEEASCSSIVVQFDPCPDILRDLSRPRFVCLKQLTLLFSGITNIEALNFLDVKVLQRLNLNGNLISNVKSLNKLLFTQLELLDLSNNCFEEVNANGLKSNSDKFELDFMVYNREREIQSIAFLAKSEGKKLTQIMKKTLNSFSGVKPSHTVVQKNLVRALRRKFLQ